MPACNALRGRDAGMLVPIEASPCRPALRRHRHTYESEVGFQVFDRQGSVVLATANLAALPPPAAGDADFQRSAAGRATAGACSPCTTRPTACVIRTGERYDSRHDIMHALWLEHGLPLLFGLPLLALLVGWAVQSRPASAGSADPARCPARTGQPRTDRACRTRRWNCSRCSTRSTVSWTGWRMRWNASAVSAPTWRTNCARRWPRR